MIFIFGWEKQTKPLGDVGRLYCFECKRVPHWVAVETSEWVTFCFLRVLKFSNKHGLHCEGCGWALQLESSEFKQVDRVMRKQDAIEGTQIHTTLSRRIEDAQLAGKTPTQIKFIRESLQRAEQDRQARTAAAVERD